jgi:hypothetical protein
MDHYRPVGYMVFNRKHIRNRLVLFHTESTDLSATFL